MKEVARAHRPFLYVLAAALLLRVLVEVAYWPALIGISDIYGYVSLGTSFDVGNHFVVAPDRPLGYPLLIWLISLPAGFSAGAMTILQHLAGLLTGTLAYLILVRLDVRRWLAIAAAAVILLDTYAIALEQNPMPETWFTLGLVASAVLASKPNAGPWALAASGLILGLTTSLRLVGLVAIPVFIVYLVWRYRPRPAAIALPALALAIPLIAYAAAHQSETGRIGFTDASGWFLYGRVAYIADCEQMDVPAEERPLCEPESRRIDDPGVYLWEPQRSPARIEFGGGWGATPDEQARVDGIVGSFARRTILARPLAYLGLVARTSLASSSRAPTRGSQRAPSSCPPKAYVPRARRTTTCRPSSRRGSRQMGCMRSGTSCAPTAG